MKIKIINILMAIFLLAGLAVLLYPFIGFELSDNKESYAIQEYDDRYAKMKEENCLAERKEAEQYNESIQPGMVEDPFTKSPAAADNEYLNTLNADRNGMMCYIEVPKISLRLPVYHGTSSETLQRGVGHLEGTHLPIGGAGNHAVLTGHTGIESSVLFTNLKDLKEGDEFYIHVLDEVLAYKVDQVKVVLPSETEDLQPVEGQDYVTLVTCTPYGINSHRLLVRGKRVPYTKEEIMQKIAKAPRTVDKLRLILIASIAVTLIIIFFIIFKSIRRKK